MLHTKNIYLNYNFHSVQNPGMTHSIAASWEYLSFTEPTHAVKRTHRITQQLVSPFKRNHFT